MHRKVYLKECRNNDKYDNKTIALYLLLSTQLLVDFGICTSRGLVEPDE